MKRLNAVTFALALALPLSAGAMEFQTPGALGMGRAGVARTTDAYATFINPAGLAFYDKSFNMKLGAGVGVSITSSLADNVDKIGKLGLSSTDMNYGIGATAQQAADAVAKSAQFAAIVDDLAEKKGNLAVNVDLALGFQFKNYGLGVFGVTELGAGIKDVDTTNLRIGSSTVNGTTSAANINTLATDIGITAASPSTYTAGVLFTQAQFNDVVKAFTDAGATPTTASQLAVKLESELAKSGVNTAGLTTDQLVAGLKLTANTINPANDTIDNNKSTVVMSGLALAEVPLAYGHKFDLGSYGKIGIGAAAKVMKGSVYYNIQNVSDFKDSTDIVDKAKDQHTESTQFGLDLGALWRLEEVKYIGPVNIGLSLKNLNSPKFDGPVIGGVASEKVKVEPQARLGVAVDPFSWLSIAADLDLTKNKTVFPGRDSQLFGGGVEAHFDHWYALWLALRVGAYKNIGETGSKPVITAGLSLGPQYFRFDLNAAVATEKGRYDNKSYPNEAKVEFGLSTAFF